jgi:predicted nucleic acid-binding protein
MNAVRDKIWRGRSKTPAISIDNATAQVERFLALKIDYTVSDSTSEAAVDLSIMAWEYVTRLKLSAPDATYLACARYYDAELWISENHEDNFARIASKEYAKAHLLRNEPFGHF